LDQPVMGIKERIHIVRSRGGLQFIVLKKII